VIRVRPVSVDEWSAVVGVDGDVVKNLREQTNAPACEQQDTARLPIEASR
jgi:hypothetical protein